MIDVKGRGGYLAHKEIRTRKTRGSKRNSHR